MENVTWIQMCFKGITGDYQGLKDIVASSNTSKHHSWINILYPFVALDNLHALSN